MESVNGHNKLRTSLKIEVGTIRARGGMHL